MFPKMTRRDSAMMDLAMLILRFEANRRGEFDRPEALRLALHTLRPLVDKHTLATFWRVASDNPHGNQRTHNLRKLLKAIETAKGWAATGR